MAGELMGGITHDQENYASIQSSGASNPGKVETDVEGVFADGEKNQFPIFNVDEEDFFNNMKADRRRLRFKPDNSASQYLRGTKYNKPFFIQYKGDDGHFMRKVK